ncbi:MAG: SusC/RagA family TonB-linked outer membrane protein, partial [Bacteroidales bacterium]
MGKKAISNFRHRLLLTVCLLFITCSGIFAQSGITADFKDAPLKVVLESISNQSKFKFVYTDELKVDGYNKVTVVSKNESAQNLFNKVFNPINISYTIKGNQVVLGVIKTEAIQSTQKNASQTAKIHGLITESENGESLPGVTIQNITRNKAISSDLDGKYVIDAAQGDKLLFSSIGMANYEVVVGKQAVLNVVLSPDAIALADVVVTGYQTLSKERATGSFNVVKVDQLEKPTSNIASRLVGTSAGVQTTTDADGNISFEIRGQTSLLASAQPLVVVDGFPIQGGFSSINPNDVESVTILKDAAAASIWGAKSANGVIIVVTKTGNKGKKGEVKVDVSTFWKFSPKLDLDYMDPVASSAEVVEYERKGFRANGFFGCGYFRPNEDSYQDYAAHSLAVTAINENRLGYLSTEEMDNTLRSLSKLSNRDQIRDYILDSPFAQQYNINISTSTERASHMLSLMFENSNSNYQGDNKDKYNIAYRTNVKMFKWLDFSFGGNFNMVNSRKNSVSWTGDSPYQMLVNEDGSRTNVSGYYMPNINRHVPTGSFPYSDWSYNPLTEREGRSYKNTLINYRVQAGLTAKIIKGLTVDSKVQYEQILENYKNIDDESTYIVRNNVNTTSTWDKKTNNVTANLPSGGTLKQGKTSQDYYSWRNQVNFNRGFNDDKHQISFIAGAEISSLVIQGTGNPTTYGYNNDKLTVGQFPNGVGGSGVYKLTNWQGRSQKFAYTNSYSYSTERYFSLYANASYTFNKKYTVSGSARTDASNLITDDPKYRYAPFWSVGVNWNIMQENFMKNIEWLDRLSIRATYGYNGNVDRSTSFMPLIKVYSTQDSYIQDFTASISSYGNPALRWEKTGSFDLGIDYAMFNGKLYGKIDFYNKKGKDLIVSMSIPSVNG